MRKFLINIIVLCIVAVSILCLFTWIRVRKIEYVSYRLSDDTHSIALGPSTMQSSVNDTLIAGLQNISRDGTGLPYLVPLLPRILDENPQIDTVYINHGRFMYLPRPSVDAAQKMQFLRDKLPFIWNNRENEEWSNRLTQENFYAAILNSDWKEILIPKSSILDYGLRFSAGISHNLKDASKNWSIAWYDSITALHGTNVYTKEEILEKCALTEKYSRMAIDICKSHNVVPVLFFTPLYHYERWFPYDCFCSVLKDYDQELLVADYENFKFSNDSLCRRDVHHLNIYGANEFSESLAKNGIRTVKLKDWLSSKKTLGSVTYYGAHPQ
ncbi:MAG: hypothetical protein KBT06_02695 [Prevotellaceae bacterium]|nr:hypothetical protein [Candidatus Colivivens equi]